MKVMEINNEEAYFNWLCEKINHKENFKKYGYLCSWLYNIDFYSILPNDDNRLVDGHKLRELYGIILVDKPCSMLEMLISLADRMDYILYNHREGNQISRWFWLLIENLNLESVENDDDNTKNHIIITRFLERKYSRNGSGGLFPLKYTRKNQREVEIWYQMMDYIAENFSA